MLKEITYTIERWEGGYSNHAHDPGGETNFGISKAHNPTVDIKNLTKEQAIQLYAEKEWAILKCEQITSQRVRWKLFDIGVNLGTARAAMILQKCAGVKVDGKIGQETISKVNSLTISGVGECRLLFSICEQHMRYYVKKVVKNSKKMVFLDGWTNRAFDSGAFL